MSWFKGRFMGWEAVLVLKRLFHPPVTTVQIGVLGPVPATPFLPTCTWRSRPAWVNSLDLQSALAVLHSLLHTSGHLLPASCKMLQACWWLYWPLPVLLSSCGPLTEVSMLYFLQFGDYSGAAPYTTTPATILHARRRC